MLQIEYRLYYNTDGKPTMYTTEKPDGNYVVITREQYAICDWQVIVVDGEIKSTKNIKKIYKLQKSTTGIKTSKYDINILLEDNDDVEHNYWTLVTHEYTRNR